MTKLTMEEFWGEAEKSRRFMEKYLAKSFRVSWDKAEDLASAAITKAAYYEQKGTGFTGEGKLSTYLITVAKNIYFFDMHKKENQAAIISIDDSKSGARNIAMQPTQYAVLKETSLNKDLRHAVGRLPEAQRKVLEFELAECKQAEIARVLDIEIGTVKSNKFRAMKNLREQCPSLAHYLHPGMR